MNRNDSNELLQNFEVYAQFYWKFLPSFEETVPRFLYGPLTVKFYFIRTQASNYKTKRNQSETSNPKTIQIASW